MGLCVAPVVCAPGRTERRPGDRIKTDKRDAIRLARLLAAGGLALVSVPSVHRERLRDLVRCREDIRADLMRTAQAGEVPVAP
jgi:transposase